MAENREFEFAEVLVHRLLLESFPNERSAYYLTLPDRERLAILDEFRGRLRWHIARSLSKRQKEVITLYLSGKTEREIASVLGIKQQVVHTYKRRAISRLHDKLAS